MLRDGYCATRVDDVISKAGLSKGSCYHFFDSKRALGLAALDHYFADRVNRLSAGPHATETDPLRRSQAFLDHASRVAEDLWAAGCLLAGLASEAAGNDAVISKALRRRTRDLQAMLADALGAFATPETNAAELASQFLVCVEGSIVLARIYDDPTYLRLGLKLFRQSLGAGAGRSTSK